MHAVAMVIYCCHGNRILVVLGDEGLLQFSKPQFEEGGSDVGVSETIRWGNPPVHMKQQRVDLINITRYPGGGGR